MTQKDFLNHWDNANEGETIQALKSGYPVEESFAIFSAVRQGFRNEQVHDAISFCTADERYFWKPYTVSDLATAALHILMFEEYKGDKPEILYWIKNKMAIE